MRRRTILGASLAATVRTGNARAQGSKSTGASRGPVVAHIADMSVAQIDISKDFVVGARAALQDLNLKGGVRGKPLQHLTLEIDGSAASIKAALESLRVNPQVVALFGSVGDRAARQIDAQLAASMPDIAHVAPWLQNAQGSARDTTFSIFATRQEQIAYAIRSLAVMGVQEVGAVFASAAEFADYRMDVEQAAKALQLRCRNFGPTADLQELGRSLAVDTPRILLFMGGTPELLRFTQGIDKQASQRYIIAMSDVNLQSLQQSGMPRHAAVIATQVVPLLNSNVALVRNYRDTMARLFDEPPTPQSLAGFAAARFLIEVLNTVDAGLTRANTLAAFQRRSSIDVGGFVVDPEKRRRGNAFVTQSMMATDGRLVG